MAHNQTKAKCGKGWAGATAGEHGAGAGQVSSTVLHLGPGTYVGDPKEALAPGFGVSPVLTTMATGE